MATQRPPRIFISYSHDSDAHAARVLKLANDLRHDGIEAILDQYLTSPPEGWHRWMDGHIRDADFVVMVCTETYYRRVVGKEDAGEGLGVRWEGNLIYAHLYGSGVDLSRFVPVLTDGCRREHVPEAVRAASYYFIDRTNGYVGLLRRLFSQPAAEMPPVGERRPLTTLSVQWHHRPPETELKLLPPRYEHGPLSSTPQIDTLLSFRTPLTRLYGAYESIVKSLVAWAQLDNQTRARFLCGPPGIGKSRVAAEAAFFLNNSIPKWLAGFVPDSLDIGTLDLNAYNNRMSPLFIIIDNADGRVNTIRAFLSTILELKSARIKVLFLSRRPAVWWQNDINRADAAHICDSEDIPDNTLTIEEAAGLFHQAVKVVCDRMNRSTTVIDNQFIVEWIRKGGVFHCRPLMIIATAAHMAINNIHTPIFSAPSAIQRLAVQECIRIDRDGQRCRLSNRASHLLVVAAIMGRLSLKELGILSSVGFDLPPYAARVDALNTFSWWDGKYIYPLSPDVLSAALVINVIQEGIDDLSSMTCWIEALMRRKKLSDLMHSSTLSSNQISQEFGIARAIRLLTDIAMLKNTSVVSILSTILELFIENSNVDLYSLILLCSKDIVNVDQLIAWHIKLNNKGGSLNPTLEVCRLCSLAQLYLIKNSDISMPMFGSLSAQACRLAMQHRLNELGGKILANIAHTWASKGNFRKATRAYKFAISFAEKLQLNEMVYDMMNDYHLIAMRQGKYVSARKQYDALLKSLLKTSPTLLLGRLRCQINRAICCDMLGEDQLALIQYNDILQEAENNNLLGISANCFANMGHIYVMRGDNCQAEEALRKALQAASAAHLLDIQSGALHTFGLLSLLKDDIFQAKIYGKKAFDAAARLSSDALKCPPLLLIAETYLVTDELDLAERSIRYCKNHSSAVYMPMIELISGIIDLHYGCVDKSINAFSRSIEFSDRILRNNRQPVYKMLYIKAIAMVGLWLSGNTLLETNAKSSYLEAKENYAGSGAILHAQKLCNHILRAKCINKKLDIKLNL